MPINPDDIDDIARGLANLYREAEWSLIEKIRRSLDHDIEASTWAADRLAAVGALRRSARSVVAGLTADTSRQAREAVAAAYRTGRGAALADLPDRWYPRSGIGQAARAAQDTVTQTAAVESLAASLVRDVGNRSANILRDTLDAYRSVIASAGMRVLAVGQTRREAAQAAWQGLVDRGITSFTDSGGRRWQLSSYVEMATRTVTQRAAVQGQTDRLSSLGVRLGIVSDAVQECSRCRPWERRVLRLDDGPIGQIEVEHATRDGELVTVEVAGTIAQARADGLWHPNCRHSLSAYLPGVTRRPTGPTEDPDGDIARRRQRELERRIRRQRARAEGALTPEARTAANRQLRAAQADLREHLAQHPSLKRLRYRESRGAGNTPSVRRDVAGEVGPDTQLTIDGGAVRLPRTVREAPALVDEHPPEVHGQGELDFAALADPLHGVDLETIGEDELYDLFSRVSALDEIDERTIQRLVDEMDRREAATPVEAAPAEDWLAGPVDDRYDWPSPDELTDEQRRLDELLDQGWDYQEAYGEAYGLDVAELQRQERAAALDRLPGESVDQAVRRAYDEWVHLRYLDAEDATRGHMLTAEGEALGIDPRELWSGNISRARKYASEDLQRWWVDNPRKNLTQFRAELLGREEDIKAAERTRLQSNDRDFI